MSELTHGQVMRQKSEALLQQALAQLPEVIAASRQATDLPMTPDVSTGLELSAAEQERIRRWFASR